MSQLVNDAVDAVLQMWLDKPSNGSAIEMVNVEFASIRTIVK